ncbi:MAG: energy-converting hydrogenase A subunit A EhaA [Methanobacteriaceae archaeon]
MIIHVNEMYLLINYIVVIIVAILIALILKVPILPEKPRRFSNTASAIFPTPIIGIGLLAVLFSLGFYWLYDGLVLAIIIGAFSAIFVKFGFKYIFPAMESSN